MTVFAIEKAEQQLKKQGWSVGDAASKYPEGVEWVVSCGRGGFWFNARGKTQSEAWMKAVEVATAYDNSEPTEFA